MRAHCSISKIVAPLRNCILLYYFKEIQRNGSIKHWSVEQFTIYLPKRHKKKNIHLRKSVTHKYFYEPQTSKVFDRKVDTYFVLKEIELCEDRVVYDA